MTQTCQPPDIVADGASDVMAADEIVHVPAAAAELAESIEHKGESAFIADISDWHHEDRLS